MKRLQLVFYGLLFGLTTAFPAAAQETKSATSLQVPSVGVAEGQTKPSAADIFARESSSSIDVNAQISASKLSELDTQAVLGDYKLIPETVHRFPRDPTLLRWLLLKSTQGHVYLMWDLAEYYAQMNSIEDAVKWTNTALIGLFQERQLCTERTVDQASGQFVANHSRLQKLTRANPFNLAASKIFAMDILSHASQYPSPELWLCKPFAHIEHRQSKKTFSYPPQQFSALRAQARNELRKKLQIPQPPESVPP